MALVKKDAAGRVVLGTHWPKLEVGQPIADGGPVLVPLATWLAERETLLTRNAPTGVWLGAGELLSDWGPTLAADVAHLGVIAVAFAVFGDGRGYSTAHLLRNRYGYTGELRAIGDVLLDQIVYLGRTGFDAFEVKGTVDVAQLETTFNRFPQVYQPNVDGLSPIFRRRREAAATKERVA